MNTDCSEAIFKDVCKMNVRLFTYDILLKKTCRCKKITLYLQINMYSRELYNCVEVVQFIIPWNKYGSG